MCDEINKKFLLSLFCYCYAPLPLNWKNMIIVIIIKSCCFQYNKPKIPEKNWHCHECLRLSIFFFLLYPIGSSLQNSYSQHSSHSLDKEKWSVSERDIIVFKKPILTKTPSFEHEAESVNCICIRLQSFFSLSSLDLSLWALGDVCSCSWLPHKNEDFNSYP